jgi:hypothetical protein
MLNNIDEQGNKNIEMLKKYCDNKTSLQEISYL